MINLERLKLRYDIMKKEMTTKEPWIALLNTIQDNLLRATLPRKIFGFILKKFLIFLGQSVKEENVSVELKKNKTELSNDGFTFLPKVSEEKIDAIVKYCSNAYLMNPWHPKEGTFLLKNRPFSTKTAKVIEPLKCPYIDDLVYDETVLKLMASIFKCKFVIDSVDIWWSFPTKEVAQEAENYHRDTDSTEFYKRFIYITDVDCESGPTTIIPKSHLKSGFFSGKRYLDNAVESSFKEKKVITGNAGTNFIANTLGLHKGQKPKKGIRLIVQFRYSLHGSSFRYRGQKILNQFSWVSKYIYRDYLGR